MKRFITLIIAVFTLIQSSRSQNAGEKQEGTWDVYLASYDEGVGSTIFNMDLIKVAPKKQLPFLVVTGVTFKNCTDDGLPNKGQLDKLYEISDKVVAAIAGLTASEHAGSFTYKCDRLDYVYVSDTSKIRSKLVELYSSQFGGYEYHIKIENDEKWEAYTTFLYPNQETQEYMGNQKVIDRLIESGDNLIKPRKVDHWMYFKEELGRSKFERFITGKGFKIENKSKQEEGDFPYALHISRIDKVDIESITKLTSFLRQSVEQENGDYDGWETSVIKK
jgi:hypothetical protein